MKSKVKTYNNNIKTEFIRSWKCYRDDCLIFWKCPWEDINNLHNLLQNLHPKITFIIEHSFKELPFLDMLIRNWNDQIIIDIYPQTPKNTSISKFTTPKTA